MEKRSVGTKGWLPKHRPLKVAITSGASCPDMLVDEVMLHILSYFENTKTVDDVMASYQAYAN